MSELCELCSNKYPLEMMIDKKYCDFSQCYDCLFSMNFNDKNILNGSMGINIKDYIEISTKHHALINEIPCSRLSDNGGCYICMKLLDIPFELPELNDNKDNKNKEDINIINTGCSHENKVNTTSFQTHILTINSNDLVFETDIKIDV